MANEIYHQSNWGSPKKDDWGDSYFNPSATNKLYARSDNYENVEGTDKALASKPDTQSVLMTPTAYSVGSMNSILPPYEVLPTEFITNGDFATDSDWTKGTGTTISGGNANFVNATGVSLYQNIGTQEGSVKVVFNVTNYTSGTLNIYSGGNQSVGVINVSANALGTYTADVIRTGGNNNIIFGSTSGFTGSIDNVSVKEIQEADFTFDRSSTATRVNKEGLIETVAIDTPRLDYPFIDGVVQIEPALLLEPATTNQLQYSEDFTQSEWSKSNVNTPVLQTSVIAPDGTTNAYLLTNSGTSNPILFDNEIGSSTNDSTFSVFVKYYNTKYFKLRIDAPTRNVLFNIQDGYIVEEDSGVIGKIENYGNGWYRCSITHTALTSAGNAVISINDSGSISNNTLSTTGLGCYVFGAQYEVNSYPTSYIPTSGSSVTRSAETANGAGTSDDFNDSEGVLYAEIAALANDGSARIISISDGTASNRIHLFYFVDSNKIYANYRSGGTTRSTAEYTVSNALEFNKALWKWKSGDFALWINGFEVDTDNNTTMIADGALDELSLEQGNGGSNFYGKSKELAVFKEALTDTELEALTSWDSFNDMATGQEYSIR